MRKNWRNVIAIAICSAVMMTFTGCPADGEDDILKNADISLSNKNDAKQSAFADDASTGQGFTFTAKDDWLANVKETGSKGGGNATWVKLTHNGAETYSGSAGTYTLTITIETNLTGERREATIEIVCGTDKITVTVTQEGTTKGGEKPAANPVELTNAMINTGNATLAAGIYQVKANLTLNDGNNLNISPGVVIRFDKGRSIDAKNNTKIIAKGTSSQPVTFTSSSQSPAAGDWNSLYLYGKDNEFDYCIFEYGAGYQTAVEYGMIYLENATASITNCTFRNSKHSGISFRGADGRFIRFDNNTITNCGENQSESFPINAWGGGAGFKNLSVMGSNNTINSEKGIGIGDGTVDMDMTVKKYVYVINRIFSITTQAGSGITFTIEPGTTFKFEVNTRIDVKERGKIIATGTEASPITFTSAKYDANKGPGDWNGIYISNSNGSEFKHCVFEYGSNSISAIWYGMLYLEECKASVMNCIFRNSRYSGVSVRGTNSGFTEFDYNTITNCGENETDAFPLVAWWGPTGFMNLTGLGANNTIDSERGIGVGGGAVNANMTVKKYIYTICASIEINQPSGAGATMTIEPGTKMMFAKNTFLSISDGGKIVAEGTASNKIILTGSAKDRGWWQGLFFTNNNALGGSVLNHCEISYGGAGTGINNNGNISCGGIRSGVLTVKNCNITHSRAWGIYVRNAGGNMSAYPTIENNNTYSNNGPDNNSNVGSVEIGHY